MGTEACFIPVTSEHLWLLAESRKQEEEQGAGKAQGRADARVWEDSKTRAVHGNSGRDWEGHGIKSSFQGRKCSLWMSVCSVASWASIRISLRPSDLPGPPNVPEGVLVSHPSLAEGTL